VLPVPGDRRHLLAVFDVPDAVEGVVIDDALDEIVECLYVRERDSEIPDRRFVHRFFYKVCHGFSPAPARVPGNVTDKYRVGPGRI